MRDILIEAFSLIAIGMVSRLLGLVGEKDDRIISRLVFNVTLPFLVFLAMFDQRPSYIYLKITVLAWVLLGIFTAATYYLARGVIKDPKRIGVFVLTSVGGNTAFLGYAVIQGLIGSKGMPVAVVYDQFGNGIFIYTVLLLLVSYLANKSLGPRALLSGILTPPFIALIAGIVFPSSVHIPSYIMRAFELVGGVTTPLMMLIVGMNLAKSIKLSSIPVLGTVSAIKLALVPAVMYLLAAVARVPAFPMKIAVLQSAMPSMMTSVIFAQIYELDEPLAAQIVFATTFISFFTLPFIWTLLRHA
ncbi:MAG: AEC family transporter [Deltaproteobacteria bacterium]|nr:AEC family transporter [Deltaproteobacteria bacterium]